MTHNLVLEQSLSMLRWLSDRLPEKPRLSPDECVTFGMVDTARHQLGGVIGIHRWRPDVGICELSVAIDNPRVLTKGAIRHIARYVFDVLDCRRCETEINVANERSWRGVEKLGFVREGIKRGAALNDGDVYVYGMLKGECKWLVADRP